MGDRLRGRRRNNGIERPLILPAKATVVVLEINIAQAEQAECLASAIQQRFDALYARHARCEPREDRGLIAAARADLQHIVQRPAAIGDLGHASDNVGL